MSKPAFTPGPWSWMRGLEPYSDQHTLSPGVLIANGTDGTPDGDAIDQANAHLIAAAPDMYEALLAAKVVIEMMERPEGMGGRVNAALDKRMAQIDAAITKAEGRP